MLTANEARKITAEVIEKERVMKEEKAKKFCEGLTENIETVCKRKGSDLVVQIPTADMVKDVIAVCENNGYVVNQIGVKSIVIYW